MTEVWDDQTRERLRALLSVPLVAVVYAVEHTDGSWYRHVEYPELPGCVVEAESTRDAMDQLEEKRIEILKDAVLTGQPIDLPRESLSNNVPGLNDRTLDELVDQATRGH